MDNSFTPRPEHTSPGTQTHGGKRRGSPTNTHLIHRVLHDYPGTVHTTLPKKTFPSQSPLVTSQTPPIKYRRATQSHPYPVRANHTQYPLSPRCFPRRDTVREY